KGQQTDRTAIVKDMETLNRDPLALSLLSLTANGAMASLMFKPLNLAPELQTLLVPDFIRKCADLKRKREAGEVNGADEEGRDARPSPPKMARLELGEEGDETIIP